MNDVSQPLVLVLDDEKNIRVSIEIALGQENVRALAAHDVAAALRLLRERVFDAMIVDIRLGDVSGLDFYRRVQADGIAPPAIFISGHATLTEAAQAVKLGGFDFLEKPFSAEKIVTTVRRCLEMAQLREKLRLARTEDAKQIIGESAAIRRLLAEADKVARTSASVLIGGESGSGKELLANYLHANSERAAQAFVKVNCSAIPESLLESELFGYERGAFTGAVAARKGFFEAAHRGSIFLDEIADLSAAAQAKILRVLQSGEFQRVGSEHVTTVDVRVLSGTHKDLKAAVAEGRFREDLYYRLNVVPLRMPSLRERPEDIPLLVAHLMGRLGQRNNLAHKPVDDEVFDELRRYSWPGNVRELQNVLERLMIMSGARITVLDLPEEIVAPERNGADRPSALKEFRDRAERDHIIGTLRRLGGNVSQAALELGVGRTYLHRRLAVLQITKKDFLV
ncbi:MAG TPA: sigma-54 dependent transcriptional regulator [Steroidobacteraceae bacterium]|jgi:two-component system, NtrC family, nitrogen regulation response regulator NtrX|nr:sigma-54 dependent transcriptional regulator [Steroidobacteraceae bacterium]